MADTPQMLEQAAILAHMHRPEEARVILLQLTKSDPDNATVWWDLAQVAETPRERLAALNRVLALDPNHHSAREMIAALQRAGTRPLADSIDETHAI